MKNADNLTGKISPALLQLLKNNSVPHAVLLEGAACLENADFLANALVCKNADENGLFCGNCSGCKKASEHGHPDIIYCEPAKPNNPYPVDFVRSIRSDAFVMPNESPRKIYIFTNADNISVQSQNALLKILEEPPKTVVFVLCCNKKEMLLDTVISRVCTISCGFAEKTEADEKTAELAKEIIKTAVLSREYDLLKVTFPLIKEKELFVKVLAELSSITRLLYLAKCGCSADFGNTPGQSDSYDDIVKELSGAVTLNNAMKLSDAVNDTQSNIKRNANAQLNVTRFCALLQSALGR